MRSSSTLSHHVEAQWSLLLRERVTETRGPRAPPPIKQPRGLLPGRTVTPASRCSNSLSRPRAVPNPFRGATPVSKNSTTERVYSWAIGPQPATPLKRGGLLCVPRCPRADRPRAASVRSPARGHNLDRGPAPVFSWGHPPPGALPCRTPTGRNHSRALGPLPALPQPQGDSSGVPRRPAPSALTACRIAARHEAACSGLRPLSSPTGRFHPPALSGVAARAHTHSATSSGSAPPLGPRQARRRRAFERFLAGPSGARNSGMHERDISAHRLLSFLHKAERLSARDSTKRSFPPPCVVM
ncbi:hypothetical protein NDU88_010492 [Pleurodeles waltl]|uniref:Uncharacterized protein n=1 Tax=Pleurodeles waltl TaxID=8319 RepID=A0AAV7S0Y8_PLEWA|nr:hypothetical protein NDU88_010492 [Pleurodeles waltl]